MPQGLLVDATRDTTIIQEIKLISINLSNPSTSSNISRFHSNLPVIPQTPIPPSAVYKRAQIKIKGMKNSIEN
jgi:hypothetical protein